MRSVAIMAALLALPALLFTGLESAHADTGGGTGGGGGSGSITSGFHWRSAAGTNAYETFLAQSGQPRSWAEAEVNRRVPGGVGLCSQSTVIWWIAGGGAGRWVANYNGATHGGGWHGAGSIEAPATWNGRPVRGEEVEVFKQWDRGNGNHIDNTPGYTIICSFSDPPDLSRSFSEYRTVNGSEEWDNRYEKTAPYSYATTIAPMRIEGSYIGNGAWEAQPAQVAKTAFGNLYDDLAAGGTTLTADDVKGKVEAALGTDSTSETQPTVSLSEQNQKAFAKGGVINVSEFKTTATIVATTHSTKTWQQPQKRDCSQRITWNKDAGRYDYAEVSCGGWYDDGGRRNENTARSSNLTKNIQTQQNVGFWQLISVHCNQKDFEKLVAATGATVIETGDAGKSLSAVAQSKTYAAQPSHLDFGDRSNGNADAAKSGTKGFYDKECPFDCIASSDEADGASEANGAVENNGVSGTTDGSRNGAVAEETRGNRFTFFRDNDPKELTVDVWYPKSEGVVDYKSSPSAAITTTVSRWAEGTPGTQTTEGGKFTMKTAGGARLFTDDRDPLTQKNWDTSTFSNANSTILTGLHRAFTVQASWASDEGKPQVLNFKWEYAPSVSTGFSTRLGFTQKGSGDGLAAVSDEHKSVAAAIQGKCYANFGVESGADMTDLYHDNTGTGTTNGLDGTNVEGVGAGNPQDVQSNLVLQFVRAPTE
jgi:hypothetical protein